MCRKGTPPTCWWECKLVQPLWTTVWRFWGSEALRSSTEALHQGNGGQGKSEGNRTSVLSCPRDGAWRASPLELEDTSDHCLSTQRGRVIWGHSGNMARYKPRESFHQKPPLPVLDLGHPAPELWENKFQLLETLSLYFVVAALAELIIMAT